MHRIFQRVCTCVLCLFVLCVATHAQIPANSVEVSGTVGYAHVDGVNSYNHVTFGGSASYNFIPQVAAGFEYGYTPLGSETMFGIKASEHLTTYGGVVRFAACTGRVVPYVLIGFGGITGKAVASMGAVSASAGQNGFYSATGAGVSIFAGPRWGIRPEFRFERQQFKTNTEFAAFGQNDPMATVSVFYEFGGN